MKHLTLKAAAKLDKEIAELHKQKKAPARPETFYRLYVSGQETEEKNIEKKKQLEREEELSMVQGSIHRNKKADPGDWVKFLWESWSSQ